MEDCPICLQNLAEYSSECGHKYCITCLCRIKKCAMCRKVLLRSQLCISIKPEIKSEAISYTLSSSENYYNSDAYAQTLGYSSYQDFLYSPLGLALGYSN
jgi:hypothetical protein